MADDQAYTDCARVVLQDHRIDALVASFVPLTAKLLTTADELGDQKSVAHRLAALFHESAKPLVAVVDSGPAYEPLVHLMRSAGLPVFRSADEAIRSLGLYLGHRTSRAAPKTRTKSATGNSAECAPASTR